MSDTFSAWDGADGERWAAEADRYDRMSRRFCDAILEALAPAPGELVLDVGCGNGALLLAVAEGVGPAGAVTGLDVSSPMLAVAGRRAVQRSLGNVDLIHGDAQVAEIPPASFDALISRFGVMFFDNPTAAFTNLAGALRPDGRIVFTCWRELLANDWIMVPAAAALKHVPMPELGDEGRPGPFSFADPDQVRTVLGGAGFTDIELAEVNLPITLGDSVEDAVDFMRHGDMAEILFTGVNAAVVERAWDAIRQVLVKQAGGGAVELNGSVWLVTARKP
jgi:SAM-dependent methyltransferase